MRAHRFRIFCPLVCTIIVSLIESQISVRGQTAQVDRAELTQSQTAPLVPPTAPSGIVDDHAAPSPNDTDLGEQEILKRVAAYQPWMISLASPIFWTSNVALTPNHEKSDAVIAPIGGIYYQPQITKTLYANLDVRQQFFFYDKYDGFNFASTDAEAGLNYFLPQYHNLILRGEYDFTLLTSTHHDWREFFENHSLIVNAELPFQISRAQQFSVGGAINYSVAADHQSPRRNDYEAYLGYSASLTRAFSVHAVGRIVLRQYHQNGRDDLSEIISVTANYALTRWLSVSAISSFANNDSNRDIFDYDVADVGGAVALTARF